IWNGQPSNVVYDNQMNAPDGADPTTALGGGSIAIHRTGAPLLADAVAPKPVAETLSARQLPAILAEAIARWQGARLATKALAGIDVRVADLGGDLLGLADSHTIWLDDNAAGWGWFVDPTPGDDAEFTTPGDQGEQHRMDLLTVLEHELGHVLGLHHEED